MFFAARFRRVLYYYPSKNALLFEIIFGALEAQSRAVHDVHGQVAGPGYSDEQLIDGVGRIFEAAAAP